MHLPANAPILPSSMLKFRQHIGSASELTIYKKQIDFARNENGDK